MTAYHLDAVDRQLITLLREDARASAVELAQRVGVPQRTLRHRLRQLREAGVISLVGIVEPQSIGLSIIADATIEVERGKLKQVAELLAASPWISYVALPIAGGDIVNVQIRCRSNDHLGQMLNEEIPGIPGVRRLTYQIIHRIIKDVHHWDPPPDA
jgi:Lrp/AsnC family transcriptional regulator for asnA, asnC and gidA